MKPGFNRLWPVLIAIGLVLALAACGGDDGEDDVASGDAASGSATAGVEVTSTATEDAGMGPEATPSATETPVKDTPAPEDTLEAAAPGGTPSPVPAGPLEPTRTPFVPPDEDVFEAAASTARVDLASRLDVSYTEVEVLAPDTVLYLPDPLACPDTDEDALDLFHFFVQYGRFIYPYQAYLPGGVVEDLVVEPCDDQYEDEDVLYIPTPDARAAVFDLVKADLLTRGVDPEAGTYTAIKSAVWLDEALGCRLPPGEEVVPAVIDGFLVIYTLDGVVYEYHTDATGDQLKLCTLPTAHASVDAFVATLSEVDSDFELAVDEVARYNGLEHAGRLAYMTTRAYRVGLYDFETPAAARLAAQLIDDDRVSHIFVSGYVLIVQEENSPEVYSILLQYAEEVRAPVMERLSATPEPEDFDPDFPEDEEEIEELEPIPPVD